MAKYKLKLNLNDGSIVQTTNAIEIPSDSDLVHKTGNETVNGTKTFGSQITSNNGITGSTTSGLVQTVSTYNLNTQYLQLSALSGSFITKYREHSIEITKNADSYTLTLPEKTGTIATLNDLPQILDLRS